MKSGGITGVTGVPELTWCYNHNKDPGGLCQRTWQNGVLRSGGLQ